MSGSFIKNQKLFKYTLKDNFLLFLIFGIIFIVICIATSLLTLIGGEGYDKLPILTPAQIVKSSDNGVSYFEPFSINQCLNQFFFGTAGILSLTIFIVIALTKNFSGQVKNTSMSNWLSLPYSRNKIVLSKLFGILLYIWALIILCTLYFVILASIGSYRETSDMGRLFAWGIEFGAYITFIFAILSIIQISLIKSKGLALGISIGLIGYLFIIGTLVTIGNEAITYADHNSSSYATYKFLSDLKYISPKSLFANPFCKETTAQNVSIGDNTNSIQVLWDTIIVDPTWKVVVFPIIEIAASAGLIFGSMLIFKNKNLSI